MVTAAERRASLALGIGIAVIVSAVMSHGVLAQAPANASLGRTADGQPNIQGFWRSIGTCCNLEGLTTHYNEGADLGTRRTTPPPQPTPSVIDPPDGKIPYQAWAAARRADLESRRLNWSKEREVDPEVLCVGSTPFMYFWSFSDMEVTQTAGHIVMRWERHDFRRIITLGNASHVAANVKLLNGDARGHWEGNTLVVETTNFNDWSWFDKYSTFHSDALTMVERFTFTDANNMTYEATVQDPKVFTRPWKMGKAFRRSRQPSENFEFLEYACVEGEKSFNRAVGRGQ